MASLPDSRSDLHMHQLAERFLDALLDSADSRAIGPARWWERAVSALETSAAASTSFRQASARAARRLQIATFTPATAAVVGDLAEVLDDPALFARWRTVARRDAVTIAAMVRNTRTARKNKTKESDDAG